MNNKIYYNKILLNKFITESYDFKLRSPPVTTFTMSNSDLRFKARHTKLSKDILLPNCIQDINLWFRWLGWFTKNDSHILQIKTIRFPAGWSMRKSEQERWILETSCSKTIKRKSTGVYLFKPNNENTRTMCKI